MSIMMTLFKLYPFLFFFFLWNEFLSVICMWSNGFPSFHFSLFGLFTVTWSAIKFYNLYMGLKILERERIISLESFRSQILFHFEFRFHLLIEQMEVRAYEVQNSKLVRASFAHRWSEMKSVLLLATEFMLL